MRDLHLIGLSSDHDWLLLAEEEGSQTPTSRLVIDERLLRRIRTARGPARDQGDGGGPSAPRSSSASGLTPREIQARLRAGRSLEEVAEEAGVGVDWIDRFAAPVLAERAAAVSRAGQAVLHGPRRGLSDRPLEASVRRNLIDRGVTMTEEELAGAWSARLLGVCEWLVTLRFPSKGRTATAEWVLDTATGTVTARNRLATELGYVGPARQANGTTPLEAEAEPVGDSDPRQVQAQVGGSPAGDSGAKATGVVHDEARPEALEAGESAAPAPATRRKSPSPSRRVRPTPSRRAARSAVSDGTGDGGDEAQARLDLPLPPVEKEASADETVPTVGDGPDSGPGHSRPGSGPGD